MNYEKWQRAYAPVPSGLESRVESTLARLEEKPVARRVSLRVAALAAALMLALCGVAYAVLHSKVASLYGWFYGGRWEQEMKAGDIDIAPKTYRLGDVAYTLEEMLYKGEGGNQGLYCAVRITPAEGSDIILLPQNYSVHEPAGYLMHYSAEEEIPEEALSYGELAQERRVKIVTARVSVEEVFQNGEPCAMDIGELWVAQPDGSILGGLEMSTESMERSSQYTLTLRVSNWEITPEGEWLREEPENTWLKDNWTVAFTPTVKGE